VVLEELRALQRRHGTAVIFISHDLGVVRQIADTVLILYRGAVVDAEATDSLFDAPCHSYTRELLGISGGQTPEPLLAQTVLSV
jgi:ABC-type dipeptide/oligopeptide/nickel transport system ATPase component